MSLDLQILRPIGGETDYSVVPSGGPDVGYICARAQLTESLLGMAREDPSGKDVHAMLFPPGISIPDEYPGSGGCTVQTDRVGIAYFPQLGEAVLAASLGALNYLAVWSGSSPMQRVVNSFYGVQAEETECGHGDEVNGGENLNFMRSARTPQMKTHVRTATVFPSEHITRLWNLRPVGLFEDDNDPANGYLLQFNRNLVMRIESMDAVGEIKWLSLDEAKTYRTTPIPELTFPVSLVCESPLPKKYELTLRAGSTPADYPLKYVCPATEWNSRGTNKLFRNKNFPLHMGERAPEFIIAAPG